MTGSCIESASRSRIAQALSPEQEAEIRRRAGRFGREFLANLRKIDRLDRVTAARAVQLVRDLRGEVLSMIGEFGLDPGLRAQMEGRLLELQNRLQARYGELLGTASEEAYRLGADAVDRPLGSIGVVGVTSAIARRSLEILTDFSAELVSEYAADTIQRLRRPVILGTTGLLDMTRVQQEIRRIIPAKRILVRGRSRLIGPEARAEMIARTEVNRVYGAGQQVRQEEIQRGLNVKLRKRWVSLLDSRVRDTHRAIHGATVGIDEDFILPPPSGRGLARDERARFPRDPRLSAGNSVNCRCRVETVPPEGKSWEDLISARMGAVSV
jgi:hypothetical protein